MTTTYKVRLYPAKVQGEKFREDQRNACYVKNRMIGDRDWTHYRKNIMGDYCRLYDKLEVNASALRSDVVTRELGSGLFCSVDRGASLGNPYKTGNPKLARPSKKPSLPRKDGTIPEKKAPSIKNSTCDMQVTGLPGLKAEKPFLKTTCATALQNAVRQVDAGFQKFFSGDAAYPSWKKPRDIGLHYPTNEVTLDLKNRRVKLPGVGWMRFKDTREMKEDWKYSKFQVTGDVDQWYLSIVVENGEAPLKSKSIEAVETVVGGDKGIKKLLSVSGSVQFENPQFAKSQERRMVIRQRRVNRKKKGSKNRAKAGVQVAKLHRKIRRQRDDYQWKVAKAFASLGDVVAVEDLNVRGMKKRCAPKKDSAGKFIKNGQAAKSGLSKAMSDAAWGNLDLKIEQQCVKQSKIFVGVDPKFTSQTCPCCGHVDKASRDREKFLCTNCGHVDDADNNAGSNIANKAVEQLGLDKSKVRLVQSELTPKINVRRDQRHKSEPGKFSRFASIMVENRRRQRKHWQSLHLKDSQPVALAQAG
jgi:putative transposase